MTWLLRLYPRSWRRRYGGEVAAMLAGRPFSLAVAVDLVAGAIDVWLHPSATLAAATAASRQEERTMQGRLARLDCAALMGSDVTRADQWKAAGVTVGLTVVLTLAWMFVHVRIGDNPYVDSLSIVHGDIPFDVAVHRADAVLDALHLAEAPSRDRAGRLHRRHVAPRRHADARRRLARRATLTDGGARSAACFPGTVDCCFSL